MPPDEKDQETKRWLDIAKKDLGAGRNLSANEDYSAQAAFLAQQTAEKAIKGFLVWHQVRFSKQHDIRYLGDLALTKAVSLKDVIDEAVTLNPFALTFRYPGEEDELSVDDVNGFLDIAEKLYTKILNKLPKEVHP